MKNIFLSLFLLAVILQSCKKKDDPTAAAISCFTVDATESTDSTHSFLFDQCPPAYDLSYWDFGDGQYSSNPNPSHMFNHYGSYNVKLTVTSTTGEVNSITKTIRIGHYSLDKFTLQKAASIFARPFYFNFTDNNSPGFSLSDTIHPSTTFPLIYQFNNSTVYDILSLPDHYTYSETDSAGINFSGTSFNVASSQISKNVLDTFLLFNLTDTAKFTLYFKFLYR